MNVVLESYVDTVVLHELESKKVVSLGDLKLSPELMFEFSKKVTPFSLLKHHKINLGARLKKEAPFLKVYLEKDVELNYNWAFNNFLFNLSKEVDSSGFLNHQARGAFGEIESFFKEEIGLSLADFKFSRPLVWDPYPSAVALSWEFRLGVSADIRVEAFLSSIPTEGAKEKECIKIKLDLKMPGESRTVWVECLQNQEYNKKWLSKGFKKAVEKSLEF